MQATAVASDTSAHTQGRPSPSTSGDVVESPIRPLLANPTTLGPLASETISRLEKLFAEGDHSPNPAMWDALSDLASTLERMANRTCPPLVHLSSLDPGVGKTQTVVQFAQALLESEAHRDVGMMVCVSRLDEVKALIKVMGLSKGKLAVVTSDKDLNQLGSDRPRSAPVMITTQQMIEKRCEGRLLADVDLFHFMGHPREVRIWDETMLPGQTLVLNRDDIGHLLKPLRGAFPELTATLEDLFYRLRAAEDGSVYQVPNIVEDHGVELAEALAALQPSHPELTQPATALWMMAGRLVGVRQDGLLGNTIISYRDNLPKDLAPLVVLDASGRVRGTYRLWREHRGGLVTLRAADKDYGPLEVNVWRTGGSKHAYKTNGSTLVEGIVNTINDKPGEDWLVVCHKPRPGMVDVEEAVRELVTLDQAKVSFITWGNHHATNDYRHVANVILAGTLFYPSSLYESLGRLAADLPVDGSPFPEDSMEDVVKGEHAHLVLQAVCRGAVRLCHGSWCAPCNAYIIAAPRSGIEAGLKEIFPGCKVGRWHPVAEQLSGRVLEAVQCIDEWCLGHPPYVLLPFKKVREALGGMSSANFRQHVRRHPAFVEALERREIMEYGSGIYPTGFLQIEGYAQRLGFKDESVE